MATTAVTLDGFPLFGSTTPEGGRVSGFKLEGWLGGANDRNRSKRSSGHGSWSSKGRRSQKPIVAKGLIRYPSAAAAAAERRAMLALGGYDGSQFVVTDSLGTLGITVEVDDVEIPPVHQALLEFSFELVATDPFARATTPVVTSVAAGTTGSIMNDGTAAAEIEVTLTSGGTVDLTIAGLRLRTSSLPSGSVLTSGAGFSNRKRTIVGPDGANLFSLIVQPMQWPALAPGASSPVNAGTADLDIKHYATYL